MRTLGRDLITKYWVAARFAAERNARGILFAAGAALLLLGTGETVLAQTGGEIFQDAVGNIACNFMPGSFGAMISAFAGLFALIAAATGAYRGAWALVFVSVGAFIFKEFIQILFPDSVSC